MPKRIEGNNVFYFSITQMMKKKIYANGFRDIFHRWLYIILSPLAQEYEGKHTRDGENQRKEIFKDGVHRNEK